MSEWEKLYREAEAAHDKIKQERDEYRDTLEFIASNVTWVDPNNQNISHTYAMGTVDKAREVLAKHEGKV